MKISTRARYALRLMIDLADRSEQGTVILRDIAERQQISKSYLEQLTMALKNAHLLTAAAGRGGGFSLARPAKEIMVGEIVRAAIGDVSVVACVREPEVCARTSDCPSRKMWVLINRLVDSVLDNTTLEDLAEGSLPIAAEALTQALPCAAD